MLNEINAACSLPRCRAPLEPARVEYFRSENFVRRARKTHRLLTHRVSFHDSCFVGRWVLAYRTEPMAGLILGLTCYPTRKIMSPVLWKSHKTVHVRFQCHHHGMLSADFSAGLTLGPHRVVFLILSEYRVILGNGRGPIQRRTQIHYAAHM